MPTVSVKGVVGEEVNVADIVYPGTTEEEVIPEDAFSFEQVDLVRSLADELILRRSIDMPDLSDDIVGIMTTR